MTDWIADGEKYALIGLDVSIEQPIPFRRLTPELWVWTGQKFDLPLRWREWLGSIRGEEIESCNLTLLSKKPSVTPDVFDQENEFLQRRVRSFYIGLLLSSAFTPANPPIALSGCRRGGEIDVRREFSLDPPARNLFRDPPILPHEVDRAASLGEFCEQLATRPPPGGAWRIFRVLSVCVAARTTVELLDRLHQYCRCIDGLILSEPGNGARQFKSRTELFIGPREHDLMGELYAIRSHIEHLHEHKYLETFDRTKRLDLVQKEAIVEHIARTAVAHLVGTPALWPHFGNTAALGSFWKLDPATRQTLWGPPSIKFADALDGYDPSDPTCITDEALGKTP